jgi:hypothetical protein
MIQAPLKLKYLVEPAERLLKDTLVETVVKALLSGGETSGGAFFLNGRGGNYFLAGSCLSEFGGRIFR